MEDMKIFVQDFEWAEVRVDAGGGVYFYEFFFLSNICMVSFAFFGLHGLDPYVLVI